MTPTEGRPFLTLHSIGGNGSNTHDSDNSQTSLWEDSRGLVLSHRTRLNVRPDYGATGCSTLANDSTSCQRTLPMAQGGVSSTQYSLADSPLFSVFVGFSTYFLYFVMFKSDFNVEKLIYVVKDRPCLWDLSSDDYMNRGMKTSARRKINTTVWRHRVCLRKIKSSFVLSSNFISVKTFNLIILLLKTYCPIYAGHYRKLQNVF